MFSYGNTQDFFFHACWFSALPSTPWDRLIWNLSKFSQEWYQICSFLSTPDPFWLPLNAKTSKDPAVMGKKPTTKQENLFICYSCTGKVANGEQCFNGFTTDYVKREVTSQISFCIRLYLRKREKKIQAFLEQLHLPLIPLYWCNNKNNPFPYSHFKTHCSSTWYFM